MNSDPIKLTIIGAGPGGYVAAIRTAQKGAQVTVVGKMRIRDCGILRSNMRD